MCVLVWPIVVVDSLCIACCVLCYVVVCFMLCVVLRLLSGVVRCSFVGCRLLCDGVCYLWFVVVCCLWCVECCSLLRVSLRVVRCLLFVVCCLR